MNLRPIKPTVPKKKAKPIKPVNSMNLSQLRKIDRSWGNARKGPRVKGYKSCKCKLEHIHDSRGEAAWCNMLELRRKAGDIKKFEIQKTFQFFVNDKKICGHRVDFVVFGLDGQKWVEEYKGWASEVWQIKKKLFEALYPDIEYIVINHKC